MREFGLELGGGAVIKDATVAWPAIAFPTTGPLDDEVKEEVVVLISESDIEVQILNQTRRAFRPGGQTAGKCPKTPLRIVRIVDDL